jgi:hypothetical protein
LRHLSFAPQENHQHFGESSIFYRRVKMILDISQLQHHLGHGKSEFVRDKAIAPHRARRFSLSDRTAPERPALSHDI